MTTYRPTVSVRPLFDGHRHFVLLARLIVAWTARLTAEEMPHDTDVVVMEEDVVCMGHRGQYATDTVDGPSRRARCSPLLRFAKLIQSLWFRCAACWI
jgi:hypothetical protein